MKYECRKTVLCVEVHRQKVLAWGFKMGLGGLAHGHCLLPCSSDPGTETIKGAPSSRLGAPSWHNYSHEILFWAALTWLWVLSRSEITQIHQMRITSILSLLFCSLKEHFSSVGVPEDRDRHTLFLSLVGTTQLFLYCTPKKRQVWIIWVHGEASWTGSLFPLKYLYFQCQDFLFFLFLLLLHRLVKMKMLYLEVYIYIFGCIYVYLYEHTHPHHATPIHPHTHLHLVYSAPITEQKVIKFWIFIFYKTFEF